jgi:lipoate-protein ligase A
LEAVTVRLLPFLIGGGAYNMAADEALLQSAGEGIASLRFYGWSEATVSLGYFQLERLRRGDLLLAALPYVRRPSGGATLVHHHEVTYALALPAAQAGRGGFPWLRRMHEVIAVALSWMGVNLSVHVPGGDQQYSGSLCFHHLSAGDLLLGGSKVVGSAQRRHRGAMLQHGAILLARSPHTPSLPGIVELTGVALRPAEVCAAVQQSFVRQLGWGVAPASWTPRELRCIDDLVAAKYGEPSWNARR